MSTQLRVGDKLPSLREMSECHRVSIGTVLKAYLQLEKEGFIQSKPQSGFFVIYQDLYKTSRRESTPVDVAISDLVSMIFRTSQSNGFLSLGAGPMPARLFPTEKLNQLSRDLIRQHPEHSSTYLFPPGLHELQIQIAKQCAFFGKVVRAEEIVITSGTMDAVNLCLRSVAEPGDSVIVESPSYYGILQLIELFKMKAIEVPSHPKTGIDLEALSRVLMREKPKACIISSNFSNPTGALMPEENKKLFLKLMSTYRIPVIEDDVFGLLHFTEVQPKPLFAYDSEGIVQYCSSFSKTLSPGLRIGWAIPGQLQWKVEKLKYMSSMATASFPQYLVSQYLKTGGFERHLRKLRKSLKLNMIQMVNAIYSYFPIGTHVYLPSGGFLLWVQLPPFVDTYELSQNALKNKISIAPGILFSSNQEFKNCIRLTSCIDFDDHVEKAFKTLGNLALAQKH